MLDILYHCRRLDICCNYIDILSKEKQNFGERIGKLIMKDLT